MKCIFVCCSFAPVHFFLLINLLIHTIFYLLLVGLMVCLSHPVATSPSFSAFISTFPEEHSLEHKESQTNQSNSRGRELWPTRRSQVQGQGSGVREDNGCRVGGNFLPQGTGVCVCVACMCVYILSGVSIYSHGDLHQSGQIHTKQHEIPPAGRWCIL